MEIKGKVHCFFEQSGTFKREFIKLGIPAEDYDIQDNFGETDHVIDLFTEIEQAYEGKASVFDGIKPDDLIMAFFPCIYFSCMSQMGFNWHCRNYRNLSSKEKADMILQRSANREKFFRVMVQMFAVVEMKGLRIIVENPWTLPNFLNDNFIVPPSIVDKDRSLRGDGFKKPTAFWFWHCEPTYGKSYQPNKKVTRILDCKSVKGGGICSPIRSHIESDYARNFICDFIIGKKQKHSELTLFDI